MYILIKQGYIVVSPRSRPRSRRNRIFLFLIGQRVQVSGDLSDLFVGKQIELGQEWPGWIQSRDFARIRGHPLHISFHNHFIGHGMRNFRVADVRA